ncbi:YbaN family protein [Piscinibacter gummiphilus]|uniref:YbaN family protein n=1 Tax=Piscinibacter gummiphilus TaxID=946333 RepID=A0ABZ0CTU1_9BURK|nr:YbaN family protein [Piscinibacter gummiphilus]WOB07941.1 YbaN family protein [Piscinibacter gummiphilus]
MRPLHHLSTQSQRLLWMLAGLVSLVVGFIGIFLPLLPTTPFVLLAAFCFSRGSKRMEAWLVSHPRFGPMVHAWRRNRAVPLRAKQLATVMMAASATGSWFVVHSPWRWAPAIVCTCVALWLWSLPTTPAAPPADR